MIRTIALYSGNLLKKNSLSETLSHSGNYLLAMIATQGLSLISIPIFSRLLTVSDYGVLNVFSSYSAILAILLTLNTQSGIGRYYFEKKDDFGGFLFMAMLIPALTLCLSFVLSIIFPKPIAQWLGVPVSSIKFLIPNTFFIVITSYIIYILKSQRKSKLIRNFNIWKGYSSFVLSVILIYLFTQNRYEGRLWADSILAVVFGIFALRLIWPLLKFQLKKAHLQHMLSFSIPLIPAMLSGLLLSQFDRVMINHYLGSAEAGLYSFAYNIGMLQTMVMGVLYDAWIPDYYKHMNEGSYEQHDREAVNLIRIQAVCACGLIMFGDLLGKLLSASSYHASVNLIPVVVMGLFILGINPLYKRHISFVKKTIWTSVIILSSGTVNLGLNAIWIPKYGTVAAAYTTLIAYVFQCLMTFFIVKFILKTYVTHPSKLVDSVMIVSMCCLSYFALNQFQGIGGFLFRSGILLLCASLLFRRTLSEAVLHLVKIRNK
jgi:O-antigen/teichoic acid export membrane protein